MADERLKRCREAYPATTPKPIDRCVCGAAPNGPHSVNCYAAKVEREHEPDDEPGYGAFI